MTDEGKEQEQQPKTENKGAPEDSLGEKDDEKHEEDVNPSPQMRRESFLDALIEINRMNLDVDKKKEQQHILEVVEEGVESSAIFVSPPVSPTGPGLPSGGATATDTTVSAARRSSSLRKARGLAKDISKRYMSVRLERPNQRLVQVKMKKFSYCIPIKMDRPTVPTVFNQSIFYAGYEVIRRIHRYVHRKKDITEGEGEWNPSTAEDIILPYEKRPILKDVNLVFKPGNTYLVLGPPACGKTSLLKAIADRLPESTADSKEESLPNQPHKEGRIEYNGVSTTVSST
jgi:ABC-type multidrug transport system fused ATPase/permease subunit